MELDQAFAWRGREVRWTSYGSGPSVVFCHGTPWSSYLWAPYARALSAEFTTYLWDMPGYGESSKDPDHPVALDVQGQLFADLLEHWDLDSPHVVAHDYGGAVSLRAHLLHRARYTSLALVDVVALSPWGSPFFRGVRDSPEVFTGLPSALHESLVRRYIESASHVGLTSTQLDDLVAPWLGTEGQAAFYRQIAEADEAFTDEVEPLYGSIDLPVLVVWGREDEWIPVDRSQRLARAIPGSRTELVDSAGHLVQLDQPVALAITLHRWLSSRS